MTITLAVLPVLLFLGALALMDGFKLVPPLRVGIALAGGAVVALAADALLDSRLLIGPSAAALARHAAPVVEECAKAALVTWFVATRRAGFLVDAAVLGFAVGTGFALVENVSDLRAAGDAPVSPWLMRGLGATMMHGGASAVFAMLGRTLVDRHSQRPWLALVPGLVAAMVLHAAFAFAWLPPLAQAAVTLLVLPLVMVAVFARSERATREWVGAGLDLDIELLQLVTSEQFGTTRFAGYLRSLREHVPAPVVADMFCLLRLELELSVQARAFVLARGAGLELPADEDLDIALDEYEFLRRSIGRAALLALGPMKIASDDRGWHRHLLARARRVRARRCSGGTGPVAQ